MRKLILPRDDLEKQKILSRIASRFEEGKEYREFEVDEIIKSFNVDDFILFRRELVNFNYLGKDSYKGIYWLKKAKLSEKELEKIRKNARDIWEME